MHSFRVAVVFASCFSVVLKNTGARKKSRIWSQLTRFGTANFGCVSRSSPRCFFLLSSNPQQLSFLHMWYSSVGIRNPPTDIVTAVERKISYRWSERSQKEFFSEACKHRQLNFSLKNPIYVRFILSYFLFRYESDSFLGIFLRYNKQSWCNSLDSSFCPW